MTRRKPLLPAQRGAAAVEFALLIGTLVLLGLGTIEYGRAVYQYDTLVKGVRDATRYLTQYAPGDATSIAAAKCLAVYGTTDCTGTVLVPDLTTAMVTVCDSSSCAGNANQTYGVAGAGSGTMNTVTVSITGYTFNSALTGYVPNIAFGAISATMEQAL
jgi:Flp pilus assembly protein TadG